MQVLKEFSIPIKGLNVGLYSFDYQIDKDFFSQFEDTPILKGELSAHLELEKKFDHILLNLSISGTVLTECDRCTADINLPLEGESALIVKYSDQEEDTDEIVYIPTESHELNTAKYFYDCIILSLPIRKVYDCDLETVLPCNEKVLDLLEEDNQTSNNAFDEVLKNLKLDKNK